MNTLEENTLPTYHEKVRIFSGNGVPPEGMAPHIRTIRHLCAAREAKLLMLELKSLVPEYNPSSQILSQLFAEQADSHLELLEASTMALAATRSERSHAW